MPEGWTILLPRALALVIKGLALILLLPCSLALVIKGLPQSNPSFPPFLLLSSFPSCPPALLPFYLSPPAL